MRHFGSSDLMKVAKAKTGASTKTLSDLLELTGESVDVQAVERFVARDKFVVNHNGEVPINYLGDNFAQNFLDVVEENVSAGTLKQHTLLNPSFDIPILSALGDQDPTNIEKARCALAHIFAYLKTADRTKWYLFCAPDAKGIVWMIQAKGEDDSWAILAYPVSGPGRWGAGNIVISH